MRLLVLRDRDHLRAILRRVDRLAAAVNPFLFGIAVGLAMVDLIYVAQSFVDSLPVAVQVGVPAP